MTLDISDIVNVSAQVYAGVSSRREFGRGLLLTSDATLDAGGDGKVGVYSDLRALQAVFPSASEPYRAGNVWFAQNPFPKPLVVGRWTKVAAPTTVVGGPPSTAAAIKAITDGSMVIGGLVVENVTFAAANDYAAQAAALQVAIRALAGAPNNDARFENAAVAYADNAFTVSLPSYGDIGGLPSDHSSGTSIADAFGFSRSEGGVYRRGSGAETAVEALAAIEAVNDSWYWLMLEASEGGTQTMLDVSNWAATRRKIFMAGSSEIGALTANESASFAAQASEFQHSRAPISWSRAADYLPVSAAARASSVDFDQPNSLITLKFKSMPGIAPSDLTVAERDELVRKRINYYARYGSTPIYAEGVTPDPKIWIDIQYFLDWLVNAIQTDVWNLLNRLPKLPQTEAGMAVLKDTIEVPFEQAVANGGLAPGTLSPAMTADIRQSTGNAEFDGDLSNGYLVHVGDLSAQSQSQRDARDSPPVTCWGKGSGAIHNVNISFRLEQ